jgi:hypothetical protein
LDSSHYGDSSILSRLGGQLSMLDNNNSTLTVDVPDIPVQPLRPQPNLYHGDRIMQLELYEARILASEKEIDSLHRNLQKERSVSATLRSQLQSALDQLLSRDERDISAPTVNTLRPQSESKTAVSDRGVGSAIRGPGFISAPPSRRSSTMSATGSLFPAVHTETDIVRSLSSVGRAASRRSSTGVVDKLKGVSAQMVLAKTAEAAAEAGTVNAIPSFHSSAESLHSNKEDPMLDFTKDFQLPEISSAFDKICWFDDFL